MKIAISAQGAEPSAPVDPRFGRAPQFVLYDTDTGQSELLSNDQAIGRAQGAGIQTARQIIDQKAEVVLKQDTSLSPEELLDHCQGKMAHYAVPRYVEFVETLPKTETERNQYAKLKEERGITEDTWDREDAGYEVSRT